MTGPVIIQKTIILVEQQVERPVSSNPSAKGLPQTVINRETIFEYSSEGDKPLLIRDVIDTVNDWVAAQCAAGGATQREGVT